MVLPPGAVRWGMSLQRATRVQEWRRQPERAVGLDAVLGQEFAGIKRQHKTFGSVAAAWNIVPAPIAAGSTFTSLSRGTLTVRVSDASLRFELDRWLRSGGKEALIGAGMKVRTIKIVG